MYIDILCIIWIFVMYLESLFLLCINYFLEFIIVGWKFFFFKLEKKFFFLVVFKI